MSKRDDNVPGPQPMPPEMLSGLREMVGDYLRGDRRYLDPDMHSGADLDSMLRQCLRNQWLLLQVTTYGTPSVALDAVEAALSATEDLLGGKP